MGRCDERVTKDQINEPLNFFFQVVSIDSTLDEEVGKRKGLLNILTVRNSLFPFIHLDDVARHASVLLVVKPSPRSIDRRCESGFTQGCLFVNTDEKEPRPVDATQQFDLGWGLE